MVKTNTYEVSTAKLQDRQEDRVPQGRYSRLDRGSVNTSTKSDTLHLNQFSGGRPVSSIMFVVIAIHY